MDFNKTTDDVGLSKTKGLNLPPFLTTDLLKNFISCAA